MKKVICMIALAAIAIGNVSASTLPDTVKVKTKMKHGNLKQKTKTPTSKIKTKIKDTNKK